MPRLITVSLYDSSNTFVTSVGYEAASWDIRINDAGSASVTVPSNATGYSDIDYGMYIRFFEDSVAKFTMMIEDIDKVVVNTLPSGQGLVASGRSWGAVEWSDALVYPPSGVGSLPAADTVYFNYAHPDYDVSSFSTPVEDSLMYEGAYYNPSTLQVELLMYGTVSVRKEAIGYTDIFSLWIWGDAPSGGPGGDHPAGVNFFWNEFEATVTSACTFVVTADDIADWWIDGIYMLRTEDFRQAYSIGAYLTAGTHRLAVRAVNGATAAGIACVGYQQDSSRFLTNDNIIVRSGETSSHGTHTGTGVPWEGWKASAYPVTEPGFTAGWIVDILMTNEQTAGGLVGWTLGCDIHLDSRGDGWPVLNEVVARVGDDLFSVLRSMADSGYIDFAFRPDTKVLDLWIGGQQGDFYSSPGTRPTFSTGIGNVDRVQVKGTR